MRLTLRTLLAYLDDTLEPAAARALGLRVTQSDFARELIERIRKVTRRRGLAAPTLTGPEGDVSDPNTVAEYLSDALPADQISRVEENCLNSDAHLAEIASCHQILTLVLTEPVRVPPTAHTRMYKIVRRPASDPNRVPGRAVPIGGAIPAMKAIESDEPDEALLLGMGRYQGHGRLLPAIILVCLAGFLAMAVVMAFPGSPPNPPATSQVPSLAAVSIPTEKALPAPSPATSTPKPIPPKPKETVPPVAIRGLPEAPAPRLKEDRPAKVESVARPTPPRPDRRPIGKLEAAEQVIVVVRRPEGKAFERVVPNDPLIPTVASLVCLPGYKAKIRLETGILAELWANVPEQFPPFVTGVFETRVAFYTPPDGFAADLAVQCGRVFLTTSQPDGSKARLRIDGEIWDVTLKDEKSEVLLEVVPSIEPGMPFPKEGRESPRVSVALAVTRGQAGLAPAGAKNFGLAAAPKVYYWDDKGGPIRESNENARSDYYSRFPILPPDASGAGQSLTLAMQKALSDLATQLTVRDGLKTKIAERLTEDVDYTNRSAVMGVKLAIYAAAAIDEPIYLVDALNSEIKPFLREAAVLALDRWLALGGDHSARLYQILLNKQFGEEQAGLILKLLRRYSEDERKRPETVDLLINLLGTGKSVAVRELAFWTLINFVDPAAIGNARLERYDAGGRPTEREALAYAWRQRAPDIKRRNAEGEPKK